MIQFLLNSFSKEKGVSISVENHTINEHNNEWAKKMIPCVYWVTNKNGIPLFVGKANRFSIGFKNYFRLNDDGTCTPKTNNWHPFGIHIINMSGAENSLLELRALLKKFLPIPLNLENY